MASPPTSPSRVLLQGASRTTGGVLRGRALGNVFNYADDDKVVDKVPRKGKVHVYMSQRDPTVNKPDMTLTAEVTPMLNPVLKSLARSYSPLRSMFYIELWCRFLYDLLDFNRRVFIYEDDMWAIKGRFETALEDNESVLWTYDNGQDILRLLIVSMICFST